MSTIILFPNQLFQSEYLPNSVKNILLAEEPLFFSDEERSTSFNILKPFYHRCLFENFKNLYSDKFNIKIIKYKDFYKNLAKIKKIDFMFDPVDHLLNERISKYFQDIQILESPSFLINDYSDFINKIGSSKLNPRFVSFYTFYRKKLGILMNGQSYVGGKLSFDKENRNAFPKSEEPIGDLNFERKSEPTFKKIWNDCVKEFPNCIGSKEYNELALFPLNFDEAQYQLEDFVENRFENFGQFEDAITFPEEGKVLYHSCLSSSLNSGIITPQTVLNVVIEAFENKKAKLASVEGFIRQLFWREFSKFIYLYRRDLPDLNFFKAKGNLPRIFYYDLEDDSLDDIPVVKDHVIAAWETGYCHHIIRLEVIGNYMLLCGIEPHQVYKWFLDFSLDAYDWVMVMNTYSMVCYADGDAPIFSKPYIVSSNYIEKMSAKRYKLSPLLTDLYRNFLEKNKNKNLGGRINKTSKSDGTGKKYIEKYIKF